MMESQGSTQERLFNSLSLANQAPRDHLLRGIADSSISPNPCHIWRLSAATRVAHRLIRSS
jgi:hypothetical protein